MIIIVADGKQICEKGLYQRLFPGKKHSGLQIEIYFPQNSVGT
jgi:hypothetical protein